MTGCKLDIEAQKMLGYSVGALSKMRPSSVCRPVLSFMMILPGSQSGIVRTMCSAASSYVYGNSDEPTGGRKPFPFTPRRVIVVTKSTRFEDEAM